MPPTLVVVEETWYARAMRRLSSLVVLLVAVSAHAEATRWYASEPHVPLVEVEGRITGEPTPRQCAAWSVVGSRWRGVDAWGQVVGDRVLRKRKFNSVSHCYEVELAAPHDTSVLFVAGPWRQSPSVSWSPDAGSRASLEQFTATLTPLFTHDTWFARASDLDPLPALAARTRFFRAHDREFAVVGGKILIVAEHLSDGKWVARYVDHTFTETSPGTLLTYEPIAIFDMNDDGWPEIVFHQVEERWFWYGDVVLTFDRNHWQERLGMYGTE